MKSKRNITYFLRNLREKHRLSVRNQHNDEEVWYMHISPANIFASLLALILVLFIIILSTVAYTSILDLIPGYPGNKSRQMLIENILRLDSLEKQLAEIQVYGDNIAMIMEGKTPVMRNVSQAGDSMKVSAFEVVIPSLYDTILRGQMENPGPYRLDDPVATRKNLRTNLDLIAPAKGVVASRFSPRDNRYGVVVATAVGEQVMAVADGTVVVSVWSPDQGYLIQLQHAGNLLSIYRHCSQSLKNIGERVKAGEVIGYSGKSPTDDKSKGLLEFELWHNGTAVDPEGYVVF